ncbi:MAG: SDR family oxidoreductase, partial [Actinomycetota bacterium]
PDSARTRSFEADFEDPSSIPRLFDQVESALGTVGVLVLSHCESTDSDILETTIESFDRHFAVNARASWLLIREFALRCQSDFGEARIIALTSDATVGNIAYGASKAALDRITLAAAQELSSLGVTANLINPGPTDTGWMSEQLKQVIKDQVPLKRLGRPRDVANLVSFLCSLEGGFINGQLLHSNGGFQPS